MERSMKKDRHVFAFENGVYVTCKHLVEGPAEAGDTPTDCFYPYDDAGVTALDSRIVAAKHFKGLHFDASPVDDWYDIPTPALQTVMDHQRWPEEVCRILYMLLGRLLYNVGELDEFRVAPFLYGQAGTGVVEDCARQFYDDDDIGVLSQDGLNIGIGLGIGVFADKMLVLAPEIKADFQMLASELQSVVSGERVQVVWRHSPAQTIGRWQLPFIMAGSENPDWSVNGTPLLWRLIILRFPVGGTDCSLQVKETARRQMANLIRKANLAYLEFVKVDSGDIWNRLPQYFHDEKAKLAKHLHPVDDFLCDRNGGIVPDTEGAILFQRFKDLFIDWYKKNNFCHRRPSVMHFDDYAASLWNHNMRLDRHWTGTHNNKTYDTATAMVVGCREADPNP